MAQPIPITIRGVRYSSCFEAAQKLGVSPALINYYKKMDRLDEVGLFEPVHDGAEKPITIRGQRFPSYAEAARYFGITVGAVSKAVSRGREDEIGTRSVLD